MTSEGEADQKAEKNTLGEFFENNKRFLSALGLLAALTIFATNTEIEILGAVLSSMLLAATVILGMELWEKFRDRAPATAKMTGFGFTLTVILFVMAFYWLLLLQDLWRWQMIPIAGVLVGIFSGVLKRMKRAVFNRAFSAKPGQKRGWRYVAFIVYLAAILGAFLIVGQILAASLGLSYF